jgi:hypothetical protein
MYYFQWPNILKYTFCQFFEKSDLAYQANASLWYNVCYYIITSVIQSLVLGQVMMQ